MPEFSADWFTANIPHWKAALAFVRWDADQPRTAVEIGSFEGLSSLWMLENLLRHPDSRLHCIDTFEGGVEYTQAQNDGMFDRFVANVGQAAGRTKVTIHRQRSNKALLKLAAQGLRCDFVYVDGSHQAPDVLSDLVLSFEILKPGGLMICDDYLWSHEELGRQDILNSPKLAIDAFTNIFRRKLIFVANSRTWQFTCVKRED
ncbi:MAG TPA: class I SAM-dependent methyltransferase [Caulobacteraceae bacterium]|jgi:predicted O-methyltransferase YrrM|nr:class I SAM-dependent methyltransferase [Caulobacteraceae bacterium]